jgi:hypothetical protein
LNPNDPWATPPHATRGDDAEEAIYVGVGRALDTWERFESTFSGLYGAFIDPSRYNRAAMRAFGALAAFQARADQLEQASKVYFVDRPERLLESQFKTLLKSARRASARRNDIAHGQVWFQSPQRGWGGGHFLGPASYSSRRHSPEGEPLYVYSRVELDAFAERFAVLWIAANELFNAVCHGLPLQPIELLPRSPQRLEASLPPYLRLSPPPPEPSLQ